MKKLVYWILTAFLLYACVPLEDLLPPRVTIGSDNGGDLSVNPFYYQDSIVLDVVYRDNMALKRWEVGVQRLHVKNSQADWKYVREEAVPGNARALNMNLVIPIPSRQNNRYISTGDYEIELIIYDLDSNKTSYKDTFNVKEDNTLPVFSGLSSSLNTVLPPDVPAGVGFIACPQQPIKFVGKAGDNTKLRRLGFSYTGSGDASYPVNTVLYEYDTVEVSDYLNDSLQVILPTSLAGRVIDLTVFVEDVFNNKTSVVFKGIYVSCDVLPPTIELLAASKMPVNGLAYVVEGTDYVMKSILIKDNVVLNSARVLFGPSEQQLAVLQTVDLSGLQEKSLAYTIPKSLFTLGKRYTVRVEATDTSTVLLPSGNLAQLTFEVQSVQDAPPQIASMNFILNEGKGNSEVRFLSVQAGDTINIGSLNTTLPNNLLSDGKGEDDVGIGALRMRWKHPDGTVSLLVNKSFASPLEVIKFTEFYTSNTFLFTSPGIYALEVLMRDTKGQENGASRPGKLRTYYFKVQ